MTHIKIDHMTSQKGHHHKLDFEARGTVSRGKNPINQREWNVNIAGKVQAKARKPLLDTLKKVVHDELHNIDESKPANVTRDRLENRIRQTITGAHHHNKIDNLSVSFTGPRYKNPQLRSMPTLPMPTQNTSSSVASMSSAPIPSMPLPSSTTSSSCSCTACTPSSSSVSSMPSQSVASMSSALMSQNLPPLPPRPSNTITTQFAPVAPLSQPHYGPRVTEDPSKLEKSFDDLRKVLPDVQSKSDEEILNLTTKAIGIDQSIKNDEKKKRIEDQIFTAMNRTAPKAHDDLPSDLFLFLTSLSDRVSKIKNA